MGIKGRKRRLRNFPQRAEALEKDIKRGRGFETSKHDFRNLRVGVGKHKRLAKKKMSSKHSKLAANISNELSIYLKKNRIIPESYELVMLSFDPKTHIQEYLNRPSIFLLDSFLSCKKKGVKEFKSPRKKHELDCCKKLLGEFPKITLDKIHKAVEELNKHLTKIYNQIGIAKSNFVVVGQTMNGKIRLAIVDI